MCVFRRDGSRPPASSFVLGLGLRASRAWGCRENMGKLLFPASFVETQHLFLSAVYPLVVPHPHLYEGSGPKLVQAPEGENCAIGFQRRTRYLCIKGSICLLRSTLPPRCQVNCWESGPTTMLSPMRIEGYALFVMFGVAAWCWRCVIT